MTRIRQRWLTVIVGWIFIVLGIAGLFLPVLQGVLFLMIGLIILSSEYAWAHRVLEKLRARYPQVAARIHEATEKARAWMNRTSTT